MALGVQELAGQEVETLARMQTARSRLAAETIEQQVKLPLVQQTI